MKLYIVYVNGVAVPNFLLRAANHNAAEKKAQKLYPNQNVSVEYTEI